VAVPALTGPTGRTNSVTPTFTWNALGGATQYEVYVSDVTATKVQDQTVTGTTWTPARPLVSGHSYRWWVRALAGGDSVGLWSNSLDFAVAVPAPAMPADTALTVIPSFTWSALTGVITYEIYVSDLATAQVQDQTVTGTSWTPGAALLSGHKYRWWVRALGSDGIGVWSNSLDFTVVLPVLIGPKDNTSTLSPAFSWNSVGAPQYQIYVSDLATGHVQGQLLSGTTWTPTTPLLSGHSYRWWVRAMNSDGSAGVWSASLDFQVN
jgi:hypothetical protein